MTQSGSAASIEALRAGALDVIAKPGGPYSVGQVADQLQAPDPRDLRPAQPVRFRRRCAAAPPPRRRPPRRGRERANGLILIGASTGGTQAIEAVLTRLPADSPPILIVQHMPRALHEGVAPAARLGLSR